MLSESPGTTVVPTSERGSWAQFWVSVVGTAQPIGSNLDVRASASVVENLNSSLRDLREEDAWVWILGDDHVFENDALMTLLRTLDEQPEIDILVPLVTKRNPPWHLVLFHEAGVYDEGVLTASGAAAVGMPRWQPLDWSEVPESGVFEVDAAGSAGMVIRRHVLDAVGDPWFENSGNVILNEDVMFCKRAKSLGFSIYATADVTMGHLGSFNVRPMRRGGRWGALTEFSTPEEQFRHLFMPDAEEHAAAVNGR